MRLALMCLLCLAATPTGAQTDGAQLLESGQRFWNQRWANSAIAAYEQASHDPASAGAAYEALGRIYTFKGWQQESVFPGWHDEPAYRDQAIAMLKKSLA